MARASIRWIALVLGLLTLIVTITTWTSPSAAQQATKVASGISERFQDNAVATRLKEIKSQAPLVYGTVQTWWKSFFPDTQVLRSLNVDTYNEADNPRCRVYTYHDKRKRSEDTEAVLQAWLKAWWALGLHPVILTNEQAQKNPRYTALKNADVDALLALDTVAGEGLLTTPFVFPMTHTKDVTLKELRNCAPPNKLSYYGSSQADVLYGSKSAYRTILKDVTNGLPFEDMTVLPEDGTFARYDDKTIKSRYAELYNGKPVGSGGRSFSFSKNHLAGLINAHLQNNFLYNHRGGIEALNPKLDIVDSDYLSRQSKRLAIEVTRCHLTPLPKSCPPNKPLKKCFDCSSLVSSAIIQPVQGYVPRNGTFFIGTVPHPLTMLSLETSETKPSARAIRDSKRDRWSKGVLTMALPERSGAIQGVMFMSENLWKNEDAHLPDAHIWQLYEQEHYGQLEYDIGYTLPELSKSLDQLAQTDTEKSKSFQDILSQARKIVNQDDENKDAVVPLVEAWHQNDAAAHTLITNYLAYKQHWLDGMIAQNRNAFAILKI